MRKASFRKYENGNWSDFIYEGYFHQWAQQHIEYEEGPGNVTYGLIETSDGYVHEVLPTSIRFIY